MKKQIGFTLIELLVVSAISITLIITAVPYVTSIFEGNSIKYVGPSFARTIALAKSESAQRRQVIEIAPVSAAIIGGDSDWAEGWTLNAIDELGNSRLIRQYDAIPGDTIFTSDTFNQATPIRIQPGGHAEQPGDFTLRLYDCVGRAQTIYTLLLSGTLSKRTEICP